MESNFKCGDFFRSRRRSIQQKKLRTRLAHSLPREGSLSGIDFISRDILCSSGVLGSALLQSQETEVPKHCSLPNVKSRLASIKVNSSESEFHISLPAINLTSFECPTSHKKKDVSSIYLSSLLNKKSVSFLKTCANKTLLPTQSESVTKEGKLPALKPYLSDRKTSQAKNLGQKIFNATGNQPRMLSVKSRFLSNAAHVSNDISTQSTHLHFRSNSIAQSILHHLVQSPPLPASVDRRVSGPSAVAVWGCMMLALLGLAAGGFSCISGPCLNGICIDNANTYV